MRTVVLRCLLSANGRLDLNPSQSASPGMSSDGERAIYVIHNVPGNVENQTVRFVADRTVFWQTYEADYSELGEGEIVRAHTED